MRAGRQNRAASIQVNSLPCSLRALFACMIVVGKYLELDNAEIDLEACKGFF